MPAQLSLTIRLNTSAADSRRGVVRLHQEALTALGVREWDAVTLVGSRRTAAVVARSCGDPPGVALLDDVTLSNTGLREGAGVVVERARVAAARAVSLTGSALAMRSVDAATLRQALLGKVLTAGDVVSLLPRDLGPESGARAARGMLSAAVGISWTTELLSVAAADPVGPVSVQPSTAVGWGDAVGPTHAAPVSPAPPAVPAEHLLGAQAPAAKLREWLELALEQPELLARLGAAAHLGVLVSGPAGVGKSTLVRAVAAERTLVELDGPGVGALEASARLAAVRDAVTGLRSGGILLISDVDALLPADPEPVGTLVLDQLRTLVATAGAALVVTTARPDSVDTRLREPDLCDRELTVTLPDASVRAALLELLLREVPTGELDLSAVAARTPGFVVADLVALRREGALRAAARAYRESTEPELAQDDLLGALSVIRPLSRSSSEELSVGSLTLEDVGDMAETKQSLTEAVLWPLRYPDSFTRLGIDPPRGVLLYGPPGCGKTFLVRALASSGQLSVHSVKGAELMDKWVGSSEKAVRDLFRRARDSAPSLVFLDEVDALAPRRGQSGDSGVGDRVVAALLTELDGVEPLRDVVVLGATNRPELIDPALLRPGRLERLVFVPPPDAQARAAVLRAAGGSVPLAEEVDLDALAGSLEGYSAADCAALLREAALAAMRRSMDAADVTAADVAAARKAVRPSLDAAQVASLEAYAQR